MAGPNPKELQKWKEGLEVEVSKITFQLEPLLVKRAKLLEQIEAIDRLISSQDDAGPDSARRGVQLKPVLPVHPVSAAMQENRRFTPVHDYWRPTLESLVDLGGSARSDEVIDRVGKKMEKTLTREDREMLGSGVAFRWQNRVAWQRENMKRLGLLKADSPRGIWEITEKGRVWLAKNPTS
jgi:hypothetical protein